MVHIKFYANLENAAKTSCTDLRIVETLPNKEELETMADEYANRMESLHGGYASSYGYTIKVIE